MTITKEDLDTIDTIHFTAEQVKLLSKIASINNSDDQAHLAHYYWFNCLYENGDENDFVKFDCFVCKQRYELVNIEQIIECGQKHCQEYKKLMAFI